ncbi:Cytochrome P450 6k1-like 7 [Homarus americanus]|uniref:Cytochrome P450 6k1-like 7 n=1 Tax=Homarus americanus TaxID=6706 RepID=A0A8J5JDX2_HOMAM|nr:Cytochrome P450 6k1-like 7 [Homarus americanus]
MEASTWTVGLAVVLLFIVYCWRKCSYWSSRGVPSNSVFRNFYIYLHMIFKRTKPFWYFLNETYHENEGNNFVGAYEIFKPSLIVRDPGLVKRIMIQDFDHFSERRTFGNSKKDECFREMLFLINGSHWKGVRSIMSPTFTSGRMRQMYHLVEEKADALIERLQRHCQEKSFVKTKTIYARYVMDVIGTCAFGIECNSINNEEEEFCKKASELNAISARGILRGIALLTLPNSVLNAIGISFTTPPFLFFQRVVEETIKNREMGVKRGDFLDLLLEQREEQSNSNTKTPKYPIKDSTIVAQSVLFLIVGHETTAGTMAFVSYYLARNPHLQHRLRQELRDIVEEHGTLTYQTIMEAPFLDAIFSGDEQLPGTDVILKKGQHVTVPVWSLQNDPRYWTNPDQFLPDRFLPENNHNVISGTYLPFGLGPRNCIGMRFAFMEAKLALAKVILKFEMSLAPGHEELKLSVVAMKPTDDIMLVFKSLEDEQ